MKIQGRLTLGIGVLFAMILLLGIQSVSYVRQLSRATGTILADNYNSLQYAGDMLRSLNDIGQDSVSRHALRQSLALQQQNITEVSEKELTAALQQHVASLSDPVTEAEIQTVRADLYRIMEVNMAAIRAKSSQVEERADYVMWWLIVVAALCALGAEYAPPGEAVLDSGCGEGYYTERLFRFLEESGSCPELYGVDISKFALDIAAKRCKKAHFAVASAFHMPLPDASFDLILNLFAPYSGAEYIRLLKPEGYFLMAIPGENHLWELKQAVYPKPYKNKPKSPELEGFAFLSSQTIRYCLTLESGEDIQHLFAMTPYYYRTPEEGLKRLAALSHLEVQCEFELLLYRPAAQ